MARSSFVFENGSAIDVGSNGDNAVAFESGSGIPDEGVSDFVFENGNGIGLQNWIGVDDGASPGVTIGIPDGVLKIEHDGSGSADFPSAYRDRAQSTPIDSTFYATYTQHTYENNIQIGFASNRVGGFYDENTAYIVYAADEGSAGGGATAGTDHDQFVIKDEGESIGDSTVVSTNVPRAPWSSNSETKIRVTYDGSQASVFINGSHAGSLTRSLGYSWYPLIQIEDDPSQVQSETCVLTDYQEG